MESGKEAKKEPKITPEIVNKALEPEERTQYSSLINMLLEGKVLNRQEQEKYDSYKTKIIKYMDESGEEKSPEIGGVGIPETLRVRRRYTMSPAAMKQRRKAAKSPAKSDGMTGNRNNWQHGYYAKQFINKLKPCKSTCPQYPCSLVEEGQVEPGEDCLDKADVISFYRAIHNAIDKKEYDQFNDLAALQIANAIKIVDMLIEDIIRDGSVVKRERRDAKGNLVIEYVTHPSLLALPKLIADLGLNPAEFLITPRAKARADSDEETNKTLAEMMSRAGKAFKKKKESDEDEG